MQLYLNILRNLTLWYACFFKKAIKKLFSCYVSTRLFFRFWARACVYFYIVIGYDVPLAWSSQSKKYSRVLKMGFIKTTDHRPLTTYPPTHRPTIIDLGWNRRPDSEHVLHSIILENFTYCIYSLIRFYIIWSFDFRKFM